MAPDKDKTLPPEDGMAPGEVESEVVDPQLEAARAARRTKAVFCFVHIERTAGTTLSRVLAHNWSSYVTVHHFSWPHESGNVFSAEEAAKLFKLFKKIKAFGGHSTRSDLGYQDAIGQPVEYLTFLRKPVDRYVSHFNTLRVEMGKQWTYNDFLGERRFDNWMTKRIAGVDDVELAKRRLHQQFSFVGLTERFDESLVILRQALRIPEFKIPYEVEKKSTNGDYMVLERDVDKRAAALEHNQLDIGLYSYAQKLYEARKKLIRGNLMLEADDLQRQCIGFSYPRSARAKWSAFRIFGHGPALVGLRKLHHSGAEFGWPRPPPGPDLSYLDEEEDEEENGAGEQA